MFGAEVLLVQRKAAEVTVKEVLSLRSNVVNSNTGTWWPRDSAVLQQGRDCLSSQPSDKPVSPVLLGIL